jgi:hypothetical protein
MLRCGSSDRPFVHRVACLAGEVQQCGQNGRWNLFELPALPQSPKSNR